MDYEYWFSLSDSELAQQDVAEVNFAIAQGLPGTESIDLSVLRQRLDRWTDLVAMNTEYWRPRITPEDNCQSDAEFCMLSMITVLQRHLGVKYNPLQMTGPWNAMDARDGFIHGPLTDHGGTCASLPILYLIIGRRLGYPLFLVHTKQHAFVRWDGNGERFNIECAGRGFRRSDDEEYRNWPVPFTEKDRADGYYLTNLTPRQELLMFMASRAFCLFDNLHTGEWLKESVKVFYYLNRHEPKYFKPWAISSTLLQIVNRVPFNRWAPSFLFQTAIDISYEIPVMPWHGNVFDHVRFELRRIAGLHETRRQDLDRMTDICIDVNQPPLRTMPCSML